MPRTIVGRRLVVLLAAGLSLGTLWSTRPLEPRAESGDAKVGEQAHLKTYYFSNQSCAQCHAYDAIPADKGNVDFSRRTEMTIWSKQDKHKDATAVLTGPRGKQIAALMGIKREITQEQQCIRCHGVDIKDPAKADKSLRNPTEFAKNGVSCVVCHGAHADWVNEHIKIGDNGWQALTRTEKEQKYGLNDLWDPVRRAELCGSCHVGNAQDGKVVTHEMYAAGHPPLPGIEIATFSEAMPRHWETWSEKLKRLPADAELYKHAYQYDPDLVGQEQTRMLVISAVVSFRATMRLIAAQASAPDDAAGQGRPPAWPEFAMFDCYACHHDLKADSWRQKRGDAGTPGRPQIRPWSTALLPLAIGQVGRTAQPAGKSVQQEFNARLKDLETAFSKTPFGKPREVAARASALVQWSDALIDDLRPARFDHAGSGALLTALVNRSKRELLDFDSARQVGWGLKTLLGDLDHPALRSRDLQVPLGALDTQLQLRLPEGQQPIAGEYLHDLLIKLATFDPEQFAKTMHAVAEIVGKK